MAKRELLSPAHDTASRAIVDVQTATTRVKAIITECISKGVSDKELTKRLNKVIAEECKNINDVGFREQFRKSLVISARKWHYELMQTYRINEENLRRAALKQPLNVELNNLLNKTPYQKQFEFRRLLDDGTNPGIPVIKDYQSSVKLAVKALAAEPPKIVTTKNGGAYIMPARLRAEMAVRYAAAVENLQRLIDSGVSFCWISSHPNCSPRCSPFQGKLYSLFQGKVTIDGKEYGESGTIDGISYKPINEALAGANGDGNGCISGYNCRHRAIEYERGSKPPADYSEAEMKREYAIDKQQRAYENRIRQLKQEEKQLRACGMEKEAAEKRKQWRRLTKDYQIYSIENNRAYYPYRYVIDREDKEIIEYKPIENVLGQEILFSDRFNEEQWIPSKKIIVDLAMEYDTRLTSVKIGQADKKFVGGSVNIGGGMYLASTKPEAAIHEFAHSIAIENATKYGVVDNKEFWKEIAQIKRKYRKEVKDNAKKWISSYEHSSKGNDEFFAEAFTLAILYEKGFLIPDKYGDALPYAMEVLEVTKKYFGKKRNKK